MHNAYPWRKMGKKNEHFVHYITCVCAFSHLLFQVQFDWFTIFVNASHYLQEFIHEILTTSVSVRLHFASMKWTIISIYFSNIRERKQKVCCRTNLQTSKTNRFLTTIYKLLTPGIPFTNNYNEYIFFFFDFFYRVRVT